MKKYYHVTLRSNLDSIMSHGLLPMIGNLSQKCNESSPKIYLFNKQIDMETALQTWLGEAIDDEYGEDTVCCLLEITLPDDFPVSKGDVEYEDYSYETIPSRYIKLLKME